MTIIHQVSATAPGYAFVNRYIDKVAFFTATGSFTWQINWGSSSYACANGMGICSFEEGTDNARPAFNGDNVFFGGWATAANGLNQPSLGWIGTPVLTDYFSPATMDHTVSHNSTVIISIGPDLGGHTYDVTVRLVISEISVDETIVRSAIPFTDGHGVLTVTAGLSVDDSPGYENYFNVNSLSITEQP